MSVHMRSVSEWSIQKGVERTPERPSRPNPGNGSSFSKQRCGNATVHQQMSRAGKELAFICMGNWILLLTAAATSHRYVFRFACDSSNYRYRRR